MIINYLKLAFRRLLKDKLFTVLNVTGLTVGIAAFIMIFLYVRHELSYDKFHSKVDQIYGIGFKASAADGKQRWETFTIKGAALMRDRIPEMKLMTQVSGVREGSLITVGESGFYEEGLIQTDENFFEIFDFPILQGTAPLNEPSAAVVTASVASKYFPNQNPIGELMEIEGYGTYEIKGLVSDPPKNSHIQFKIIISNYNDMQERLSSMPEGYQWSRTASNYILFAQEPDVNTIQQKMSALTATDFPERMKHTNEAGEVESRGYLIPFGDIHLKSGFSNSRNPVGSMFYVYVFSSIGLLILFIACFNYINLVTARSLKKAKEIGLRKVVGAQRKEIIIQQMTEASLFTFLSVFLAFALAERLLPYFNQMVGTQLELHYLSWDFILFVTGLSTIVAFIAGYYPAFKLSKFSAINGLKGGTTKTKSGMRRALVLFQFFIAQALIICTFIIQSQLSYLQNKSLGYDREQVLFIETHGELKDRGELFRSELESIPGVASVSMSNSMFDYNSIVFMQYKDIDGFEGSNPDDTFVPHVFELDAEFLNTMGLSMVAGRAFDELEETSSDAIIVNETTVKQLGWKEPLGKELTVWGEKKRVVGVVRDFHDESLKVTVKPAILLLGENLAAFANVKVSSNDITATMDAIEEKWEGLVPERPLTYQFYDDFFDAQYRKESRLGNVFNIFSTVAISISVLGLIGLTTFSAQQRLKEFGVRKVLGARVVQLVGQLSKEFIWLLVIAFALATPLTYYFMSDWLAEFNYRIDIGVVIYLLAIITTLTICLLTVAVQSFKVARFNPAEVLRAE